MEQSPIGFGSLPSLKAQWERRGEIAGFGILPGISAEGGIPFLNHGVSSFSERSLRPAQQDPEPGPM